MSGSAPGPAPGDGGGRRRLSQLERIPVTELRTVGPRRSEGLAALGIQSVLGLPTH